MEQIRTLVDMGDYAGFVWSAFGLTAAVMIGLLVSTLRRLWARERALEHQQQVASSQRDLRGERGEDFL